MRQKHLGISFSKNSLSDLCVEQLVPITPKIYKMFAIAVLLLKCEVCFCICQKTIDKIWHDLPWFCQACIVRLLIFISLNDFSSGRRCLAKLFVGGILLFSVVKDVNETPTNLNKDLSKISK